jgi:sulfatase modifying factor 1
MFRRRALAAVLASAVAAGLVAVACGFDAQGERQPVVRQVDARAQLEASVIPREDDAGLDARGPFACPATTRGPTLVLVPDAGFCIDSTEVTNGDYDAFLAATGGGRVDAGVPEGGLPARCNELTTFGRNTAFPLDGGTKARPVVNIPWCAAAAYCAWSGKRLCPNPSHLVDGGPWYAACTDNGAHPYSYGAAFVSGACNEQGLSGSLEPVRTRLGCEGGVPGVFDMNGNATEWIDDCDGETPASTCVVQGSDLFSPAAAATCAERNRYAMGYTSDKFGFRCCADLQ